MNKWQKLDNTNNLIYPWYSFEALEKLKNWDVKKWTVFEYGGGYSTLWWRNKSNKVISIDNNFKWCNKMNLIHINNKKSYIEYPYIYSKKYNKKFDCIIIDGEPCEWRDFCLEYAIKSINKGGKIIIDNWKQDTIPILGSKNWPNTEKIIIDKNLHYNTYKTPNHPDWKTIIIDC
jgi:predicted O-methyltransferase YrrM